MKIALASARIIDRDIPHNLSQIKRFMVQARENGADLVCFGEAFLQGFNALSWRYEEDRALARSTSSAEFAQIKAWTKALAIDVLFGYNELDGETIYSSCTLISGGELLHNYRRISQGWKDYWKTDAHYREGTTVEPFTYKGKRCVIALCGDLWDMPERFALGEDLLFWSVYVDYEADEWARSAKLEYAQQASLCCAHTLYINSLCAEEAFGGSAYFSKQQAQTEFPFAQEGLLYIEL